MSGSITEQSLDSLKERVREYLDEKRYAHTLSVEREAERLGAIFLPDKVMELRASALLHDITKRYSLEKQLQCCEKFDIITNIYDRLQPKILHAKTAAELVRREFPDFSSPDIIAGIRWHTTGHENMTLFESIIYLADYIEEERQFPDCVELRQYFYSLIGNASNSREKTQALYSAMILSFDMTIKQLAESGEYIDTDTVEARNWFLRMRSIPHDDGEE